MGGFDGPKMPFDGPRFPDNGAMLTCAEMQDLEKEAFKKGASPEALMEKVGRRMARFILGEFPIPGTVIAFLGKGHNAGDAVVVARHLQQAGWRVLVRSAFARSEVAELVQKKWAELADAESEEPLQPGPLLLLDGLVGIGAKGPLCEPLASLASEMNHLREKRHGVTVAMDIPSGLNGDEGSGGQVVADWTLTVGVPKRGLVADGATHFVGRLELIELEELPLPETGPRLVTFSLVREYLPPRSFDFHKGQAGRVALIAGSSGMWGAAALCAQGALQAGAGYVELFVEEEALPIVLPLVAPEVMVRPRPSDWRTIKADALVIGPGLGQRHQEAERLFECLGDPGCPAVLDADALNLLASEDRVDSLGQGVLLTPHPGEMARLTSAFGSREERIRALVAQSGATVLFKGARTLIAEEGSELFYNTTGHPGMATGGQGDTLSGVLGALLAGGLEPLIAAQTGAWICGRAAEIAIREGESAQSLTPSKASAHLGAAFNSLGLLSFQS